MNGQYRSLLKINYWTTLLYSVDFHVSQSISTHNLWFWSCVWGKQGQNVHPVLRNRERRLINCYSFQSLYNIRPKLTLHLDKIPHSKLLSKPQRRRVFRPLVAVPKIPCWKGQCPGTRSLRILVWILQVTPKQASLGPRSISFPL